MREPAVSDIINATSSPPQALLERLKDYGQEDIFALWDELSPEERDFLVKDIEVFLSSFALFFLSLPFQQFNSIKICFLDL